MARPQYGATHQRARAQLLADDPLCVHCLADNSDPIRVATVADHNPPIALHEHVEGTGCCFLEPSCAYHSLKQGQALQQMLNRAGVTVEIEYAEPEPSPEPDDPLWDALPWLDELRDVPDDATWPVWMTSPHPLAVGTFGPAFERWAAEYDGTTLRWFQRLVAYRMLEHDADGRFVWGRQWFSVARQVGKSRLLFLVLMWAAHRVREFYAADQVMLCSRTLRNAELLFEPYIKRAEAAGWPRGRRGGAQYIETPSGGKFVVRAIANTYGETNGLVVLDEAWSMKPEHVTEGVEPTLLDSEGGLLVTSTAHRRCTSYALNYRGEAFEQIDAPDDFLLIEWAARRERQLDEVDGWREASPVWTPHRLRMMTSRLKAAQSGEQLDPDEPDPLRAFEAQYLNRWPIRHLRKRAGEALIDAGEWASALSTSADPRFGRIVGVEDNYGRGLAVAIAGHATNGRIAVTGIAFDNARDGWEYANTVANVELFVLGASLSHEPASRELFPIELAVAREWRGSLSRLRELCASRELTHDGSPELARQMLGCRVREGQGGLIIVGSVRTDLVRAASWAIDAAYRRAAGVGGIS